MKALKDRQTQEKVLMFSELMKSLDDKDQMKHYLAKSVQDANRELEQFKRFADKEQEERKAEILRENERKRQEMQERQNRLVNVEEALKKDEMKAIEQFRRQREEMLSRKLAD